MANDATVQPPGAGTVQSPPPNTSGTESGREPTAAPEPNQPAATEDVEQIKQRWQHDRSEKDRMYQEAQRLYQENLALKHMMQQQQRPAAQDQPQVPAADADGLTDEEYRELSNAYIEGDPQKIRRLESRKSQKLAAASSQRVLQELNSMATTGQRMQSSIAYLASIPEMNDPRSVMYQKTVQRYQQMSMDPTYSFVAQDQHQIGPGQYINPHLLRLAAMETANELRSTRSEGENVARQSSEHFTEPSGRTPPPPKADFNPMKHLSAPERDYVDRQRNRIKDYSYKTYWESMTPTMKEARLKSGKPLREVRGSFIE